MLEKVKKSMHPQITSTAYDEEIQGLIDACKEELKLAGITVINENDINIQRAIILYCKANFGDNPNADKYEKRYTTLKNSLCYKAGYYA